MDTLVQDGKRNSRQQVADSRTDIEAQAQRLVFVSRVVNCYPKPLSYSFFLFALVWLAAPLNVYS